MTYLGFCAWSVPTQYCRAVSHLHVSPCLGRKEGIKQHTLTHTHARSDTGSKTFGAQQQLCRQRSYVKSVGAKRSTSRRRYVCWLAKCSN